MTEKQLRLRARRVAEAEAKIEQLRTYRDIAIVQAVAEGWQQVDVAKVVGLTKARVGMIVAEAQR